MDPLALPTDDLLHVLADARRSLAVAWAMRTELLALTSAAEGSPLPEGGALARAGLVAGGRLQVRASPRRGKVFVADARPGRPDTDDGDAIGALLLQLGQQTWGAPDVLVDPCCGCGELALSIDAPMRLMLDRDPRALAFADLNRVLNGVPESRTLLGLADLRASTPRLALAGLGGTALWVAMLPDVEDATDGAVDLQQAALDALAAARRAMPRRARLFALMGVPGAATSTAGRMPLADRAAVAFGADRVRWTLLDPAYADRADEEGPDTARPLGALAVELD
ncbi:MAG: hypothetical protein RJA99_3859 [Pseudomonadota bacterium]|jgi:hypothetical protein